MGVLKVGTALEQLSDWLRQSFFHPNAGQATLTSYAMVELTND